MIEISDDRINSDIGRALVAALLDDLADRYGGHDVFHPTPEELAPPTGAFLVAHLDGVPVGCGGLRAHAEGVAEVKRMYVAPAGRRRGVARAVLRGLEARAAELGYARVRLETGTRQPEAMALYASSGYVAITPYGHYRDSAVSRCFEKDLHGTGS